MSEQKHRNGINRQVQYYYLEDAAKHLTYELNIPHTIATLFSLSEQGQLGIGFKRPIPDWEIFYPEDRNIPTAPNLFLDERDIKKLSPRGQNLESCTSTTSHPNEGTANDFNFAYITKDDSITEKYRLQQTGEDIVSKVIKREELFITHQEMERYLSTKKEVLVKPTPNNDTPSLTIKRGNTPNEPQTRIPPRWHLVVKEWLLERIKAGTKAKPNINTLMAHFKDLADDEEHKTIDEYYNEDYEGFYVKGTRKPINKSTISNQITIQWKKIHD
jgi:hypothetical protein